MYLNPVYVYTKFEESGFIGAEKSKTITFIGEKDYGTNKGNDKHDGVFLSSTMQQVIPNVVPNIKILGLVAPEKSWTHPNILLTAELW